ncbi:MAG TPA: hypothetical protein VN253_30270 [Kofleriaceae bacterium]|nr:hypothetical protein [Kofleriaceae bacterium]
MAALEYASSASWFINAPAPIGNKRLRAVEKYDEDDESSVETRVEVGPSLDAVGFVEIPGGKKITFDIRETKGAKPEVDYEYIKANGLAVTLTKQIIGGRRTQYTPCRLSMIKPTGDNKGEHTFSVEFVALGKKVL